MKQTLFFVILILLHWSSFSHVAGPGKPSFKSTCDAKEGNSTNSRITKSANTGLWILTARITRSYTLKKDTVKSFDAGGHLWENEIHVTSKSVAHGIVTVIIENQAENPAKDFLYTSEAGEPISITVTGEGSHTTSSNESETIDGKMINADIRQDNVSGSARPDASVQFFYSDDSKSVSIGINIKAVGTCDRRIFAGEWTDYGDNIDNYYISCDGGCDPSIDKNCTFTKTGSGYNASWKSSENRERQTVDGTEFITSESTLDVTVSPYKEPDKPEVTLNGCSELGTEEQSNVIASGKPDGGKFRFWVEPGSLLNVQSDGKSSASITGATPGKGTLYVEYTSPEGKTNKTSQQASCVKIEKYNGGQDIPQIALYDIEGKKLSGVLNIPVSAQPGNANELVDFVAADQSVVSVVGLSGAVAITGSREGKTTFQAKTNCGATTGPAVNVEVVNCDDETIFTLDRMMKAAKEGQKGAYEAIERIVGTKEFEELDSKIAESTGNLAVKTAGLIIGTLSGGKNVDAGVKTAAGIYGKASNVMDIMKGGDGWTQASNIAQLIVELVGTPIKQTIAGGIETMQAAAEFGEDLGKMIGANEKLQSAIKEAEQWNKVIIDLVNRQKLCRRGSQTPQGTQEPTTDPGTKPTEPKPPTTDPTTQKQKPPVQEPAKPEEPQPTEPSTTDQPSEDETEISPPPPTSEPRQVGLPFSPAECGCNHSSSLDVSQKGFSSLQTGMENLGKCVDMFSKGPLTNYIQTLKDWQVVLATILDATKAKPAEFQQVSEKSIPKMEALLEQTKTFDIAGKAFIEEFGTCPKSMESGIVLMRSATNVPEISTTNKQPEIIHTK